MYFLLKVKTLSFNLEKENDRFLEGLFRAEVADLKVGETLYSVDESVYLSPEAGQPATYTLEVLRRASPFGEILRPREDVCTASANSAQPRKKFFSSHYLDNLSHLVTAAQLRRVDEIASVRQVRDRFLLRELRGV